MVKTKKRKGKEREDEERKGKEMKEKNRRRTKKKKSRGVSREGDSRLVVQISRFFRGRSGIGKYLCLSMEFVKRNLERIMEIDI